MILFLLTRLKTAFWTAFYRGVGRLAFEQMGKGCHFEGWIDIPQRNGKIILADGVRIGPMTELSVLKDAELIIGANSFIGRGVLISAHRSIKIGRNVLVAEYGAIHDNDHVFSDPSIPIVRQGTRAQPVTIENDVWIGGHAMVLSGSHIPAGCVVGAKSLVTRKSEIEPRDIIIGSPARCIGSR